MGSQLEIAGKIRSKIAVRLAPGGRREVAAWGVMVWVSRRGRGVSA